MGENRKILVLVEFLAVLLAGFVLLFAFLPNDAFAISHLCSQAAGSGWKTADFSCQWTYTDTGGAGLDECEYRLWNVDSATWTTGWLDAFDTPEVCQDADSATLTIDVTVGATGYCQDQGTSKCQLDIRAVDNAHNITQCPTDFSFCNVASPYFHIDYTNPTTSITCNSVACLSSWYAETVSVALSCSDADSGCNLTQYCTGSGCTPTTTYTGSFPVSAEGANVVRFRSTDVAGNTEITKEQVVNIDLTAPVVDDFSVNGTSCMGAACSTATVTTNSSPTVGWNVSDNTNGSLSNLQQIEVWRAWDANGDGTLQASEWDDSSPAAGVQGNPVFTKSSGFDTPDTDVATHFDSGLSDGTYWYGTHVIDNADNCIDETGGHACGGVSFDDLDSVRVVRGPIKVIKDSEDPTGSIVINGGATYTTSTSVFLSLDCNDSGTGCSTMNITGDCTFSGAYSSSLGCTLTSGDGLKTVSVVYTDGAGNESSMYSDSITLDTTPPNTTITDAPPDPSFTDSASFSFTSTESGTFQCQLDGGGYSSCTSPKNYSGLSQATHTFQVKAIDLAGNEDPTPASYTWEIILNNAPSISSVNDSPDPIWAGGQITFQVSWSDPDGDSTRIHICKTDAISGQTCSGGSWCDTASFSSSSPSSCNYTTQGADAGQKSYWAFVCDDGSPNLCSPSQSETFLVDATAPSISTLTASPAPPAWINNTSPNATVDWSVSDTGGANLQQIEVWRAWDANGDGTLQSGEWGDPGNGQSNPIFTKTTGFDTLSTDSDSYVDTNLTATASYWYGLHVVDNAGNCIDEAGAHCGGVTSDGLDPRTPTGPDRVQVDKNDPVASVTDPTPGNWYRDDFTATFDDSDIGSGLAVNCEYEFVGINPVGGDTTSGVLTRSCNLDTKIIGVGPDPEVCQFEGTNRCRVRTRAFDLAGNNSGWQPFDYGVDFTDPAVGTPSPSTAQAGVSQTYSSSLTDAIGKIASCTFYWGPSGDPFANTGGPTTIDPLPCENGAACTVSADHTFASAGEYDIAFGCMDSALPSPGNTGYGIGSVSVDSLSVTLTADPSSGVTTTLFDLIDQVGGTATGLANFKFDCTNDAVWEYEIDGIDLSTSDPGWVTRNGFNTKITAPDTFAVQDLCQYSAADTYTANTLVERGNGDAQDTVDITVTPNNPPTATDLAHNNDTADYCFTSSPPIILSWIFSDPDPGDSQSAYQVQVATDSGFTSIVIDTDKVTSSNTEYSPPGLSFNTTYYWQVKVWDNNDAESDWATGPSFTTPVHAYPAPDFTWVPVFPSAEEEIQFTDQTVFAGGSINQSFSWDFGDTGTSTLQNPTHTYAENGAYLVSLEVTDDAGTCTRQKTVTVTLPFPEWQEISPF